MYVNYVAKIIDSYGDAADDICIETSTVIGMGYDVTLEVFAIHFQELNSIYMPMRKEDFMKLHKMFLEALAEDYSFLNIEGSVFVLEDGTDSDDLDFDDYPEVTYTFEFTKRGASSMRFIINNTHDGELGHTDTRHDISIDSDKPDDVRGYLNQRRGSLR